MTSTAIINERPPFPRILLVEITNYCNHRCVFCAYQKMTRPSGFVEPAVFARLVQEAYDLGARDIGLHGGAEPLACRDLDKHVATCRRIGFEYIYLTTNGTLAKPERLRRIIDAGLHSIKFSINAGDAATYKRIHGRDHFALALRNLQFVSEYRKTLPRKIFLAVSFVQVADNAESFTALRDLVTPWVDEIYHVQASNQSGQVPDLPVSVPVSAAMPDACSIPFNQATITREGYLRMCCNDYQNMLVAADLTKMSLIEAWHGEVARSLRRRHMTGSLGGTLCHNCVHGCHEPVRPLVPELGDYQAI